MKRTSLLPLCVLFVALMPSMALAHPGADHGTHHFASGLLHPLTGLDHILAMAAVGMWADQLGAAARWRVPLAFRAMMIGGGLLAALHVALPFVESAILASILILGLLLLFTLRLPLGPAIALVSIFAIFHGYVHVAEIPIGASLLKYFCGFMAATVILVSAGCALGHFLASDRNRLRLRACGGAIVLMAFLLACA